MVDHQGYWDRLAGDYDVLFKDAYSAFEDALVLEHLRGLGPCDGKTVIEIGCGTGLGYCMVQCWGAAEYIGTDKSAAMLAIAKQRFPDAEFQQVDARRIASTGRSVDYCVAINAVCSYFEDIDSVIVQLAGTGRPGTRFLLSFLNRWSLRRLVKADFSRREPLQIRGGPICKNGGQQFLYSKNELSKRMDSAGFKDVECRAYGLFGGIWQTRAAASLEKKVPFLGSALGHTIIVKANL